jgi:hypothetical protein
MWKYKFPRAEALIYTYNARGASIRRISSFKPYS